MDVTHHANQSERWETTIPVEVINQTLQYIFDRALSRTAECHDSEAF